MKDQRSAFGLVEGDYRRRRNHMIAAFIAVRGAALKSCQRILEQRKYRPVALYREGSELIGPAGGESLRGDRFPAFAARTCTGEGFAAGTREGSGMARQAPQHHGRIQRHGVKLFAVNPLSLPARRGSSRW